MAKIKMTVEGNKSYYSNLSKLYREDVEDFLAEAIQNTETEAVQAAPSNTSFLRSSAYSEINGLEGLVGFKAQYAAFQEFGTGALVDVPAEWSEYAATFNDSDFGSFEEFKISLLDWMNNKGIEAKFLYPIMMKILRIGIKPQPFLYPAWKNNTIKFLDNLKKMLNNGAKQGN